jgi:F-type H+-transporting ATPase subunit gamma
MANIKELKKRIKSTKSTLKITSAMKLVSAAKLSRAQSKILGLRPYTNELLETVRTVSAVTKGYDHPYFQSASENNKAHLVLISSDKGLCGAYNSQVAKAARRFIAENKQLEVKVHFIGKKAKELVLNEVNAGETFKFKKIEPTHDEIKAIAEKLANDFTNDEVGKVFVGFNCFKSAMESDPEVKQVLPMSLPKAEKEKIKEKFPFDFKYQPSSAEILDTMVPEVYINSVFTAILDAIASEHGMRMVAMENASKNSKEMIQNLTLKMNKLRQAAITTELIEVVSGAESLKG